MLDQNDLLAIAQLMDQKLDQQFAEQDQKFTNLKTEIIEQVNVIIESRVEKQIQQLAEGHQDILEKLPEVDKVRELEERVSTLENIAKMQRQELNAMKGA